MKRLIDEMLLQWKESSDRKPLILYGARQVGKTYSIMNFGSEHYASVAYFYFDNNPALCDLFKQGISSIKALMIKLEAYINIPINPHSTLIPCRLSLPKQTGNSDMR